MKAQVAFLEKELADKNRELRKMKTDSRPNRILELELELKTYRSESKRLQKLIAQ